MKNEWLNKVVRETRCRLKPSAVCDGVGVFAVVRIRKGERLFPIRRTVDRFATVGDLKRVPSGMKRLLTDMGIKVGNAYQFYDVDFHHLEIGHYVNHADTANVIKVVDERDTEWFQAIRTINAGEELLSNYNQQLS